jgi:hypothetical protein
VDHPCARCGGSVEDGRPFCPQCRAPQIHVQVATTGGSIGGEGAADEPLVRIPQVGSFGRPLSLQDGLFDRGVAVRSAIKAGALGIFIGMIPLLGFALTGFLAVYFYRNEKGLAPAAGIGARLGGAAGVIVSAVNATFTILIIIFHAQQKCIDQFTEIAQRIGVDTSVPQFQAALHEVFTVSGVLSSFIITLLLTSVGGALAALVLRQPPTS